jgi:hypothetical protein
MLRRVWRGTSAFELEPGVKGGNFPIFALTSMRLRKDYFCTDWQTGWPGAFGSGLQTCPQR